eukprot:2434630-Ditylum_brightwellii.AAC.1
MAVPVAIPHKAASRTQNRYGEFSMFSRMPKVSGKYFVHDAVVGGPAVDADGVSVMDADGVSLDMMMVLERNKGRVNKAFSRD